MRGRWQSQSRCYAVWNGFHAVICQHEKVTLALKNLTPEAQCLGHHEFDYALVPHSGDWEAEEALVLREAQAFNTPIRALVTEQHEGQLPSQSTLIEVEPPALVVSAIKQSEAGNGVIVRIYNPLSHTVQATIQPGLACTQAFVANLNEEPAGHPKGCPYISMYVQEKL